jgi:chitinase
MMASYLSNLRRIGRANRGRQAFLILTVCLLVALLWPKPVVSQEGTALPATGYKIVGYFVQWGMYERNYRIKQVNTTGSAARLTHINYAFANISTDSRCFEETRAGWGDAYADYEVSYSATDSVDGVADERGQPIRGHFNQIKKLKAIYPHLKVLLSIGGWSWSGRFSDAALPENRVAFVKSCLDLFIQGNLPLFAFASDGTPTGMDNTRAIGVFDGIDIDWEYPASPAFEGDPSRNLPPNKYRPEDTQNFTALLAEFRRQLDELGEQNRTHYLLTIAAPAGVEKYSKIELDKVHPYLDWINVMTYDMHGPGEPTGPTNFQAPLYASPDDPAQPAVSVDGTITAYLAKGVPSEKIVMGIPFYGRGWTGAPNKNNGLYQQAAAPAPGRFEAGIEDYKVLAKLGYPSFLDSKTQAMWIYDGKTWWNYDDPLVIAAKTTYIREKKLGGVMFWSLDGDDGTLIAAIYDGLKHP